MIFGGGDFIIEALDVITDEPEFDKAWVEFCWVFNTSNAEYVILLFILKPIR
jgi:hypothetical protein